MGKLTRKCKATGEVPSLMELSHPHVVVVVGVKTRARSLAEAQPKRRKSSSSASVTPPPETSNNSAPQTVSSGNCSTPASRCSSSESFRSVIDLEDTHAEFENSSPYSDSSMRNLHSESNTTGRQPEVLKSTAVEMPTAQEIDDFFAQLEKDEDDTKKLTQKYNFDFVNETPLEGRYEWIPLKP